MPNNLSDMGTGLYSNDFSQVFSKLLKVAEVSCYKISQFSGLTEPYLSRLKNGEKCNPSVEIIMRISLALVSHSNGKIKQHHIEELLNSAGRSLFRKRNRIDIWD